MTKNLQRSLMSGLFWVVLANLIIKPLWILGVDRGVQNAVGEAEYGLYFVVFNFAYIFNILLDWGVTNFNTRNIAQHPQLIRKHLSGILTIKMLLLGAYLLVTLTIGLLMGYSSRQFMLLIWLCINQFLNSLIVYLRSNFEGLLLFRMDSLLSVLDRILMIVICGSLLFLRDSDFTIEWFVYAQTVAYVVTALVALISLARRTGLRKLYFSWPFTWAILRKSAPFALLVLLMASYNRLDSVLLQHLLPNGTSQAGIYAGAFRLLDALTMIAYLVSVLLLPIYAKLTRDNDQVEIKSITGMMFSLMLAFSLTSAVALSFWSNEWMHLMYQDHVEDSTAVFKIIIYSIIPLCMTYIFGTLLTANGSLRQLNLMAASTLVINVAVNLWLIPRMFAVGSAWASLLAQSFMALAQMLLAIKIFVLKPSGRYTISILFYVIIVLVSGVVCRQIECNWLWQVLLMLAVSAAAALMLKLIDLPAMIRLLRKE